MRISCASEVPKKLIFSGMLGTSDNYVMQTHDFLKSSSTPWAQTSFMPVKRKLVTGLLSSENNQLFAKIAKTPFLVIYKLIFDLLKGKKRSLFF